MFLLRKLIPIIAPQMRAPQGGITGWLAMKVMEKVNPTSTRDGIERLDISSGVCFPFAYTCTNQSVRDICLFIH